MIRKQKDIYLIIYTAIKRIHVAEFQLDCCCFFLFLEGCCWCPFSFLSSGVLRFFSLCVWVLFSHEAMVPAVEKIIRIISAKRVLYRSSRSARVYREREIWKENMKRKWLKETKNLDRHFQFLFILFIFSTPPLYIHATVFCTGGHIARYVLANEQQTEKRCKSPFFFRPGYIERLHTCAPIIFRVEGEKKKKRNYFGVGVK